ncbi:MAG: suppressor of fused domain protein [Bacteroidota bacterium]
MNLFKKLFGKKDRELSEEELEQFYLNKDEALEKALGKQAPVVGHAIISFPVGGAVDMYYYPHKTKGCIFATQELINPGGDNPLPNRLGLFELVALTKHNFIESEKLGEGDFGKIERRFCGIFTGVGNFSFQAKLEPGETCELPVNEEPNRCLVFDEYTDTFESFQVQGQKYGLLLIIEVHRDEMEYAMQNGSAALFKKLKEKGYYPYSDLDRPSVVS